ncbi:hypothetical protein HAX54_020856, partial [Datura stramonium]|nr:hypothetical protein [Datura stramonium]
MIAEVVEGPRVDPDVWRDHAWYRRLQALKCLTSSILPCVVRFVVGCAQSGVAQGASHVPLGLGCDNLHALCDNGRALMNSKKHEIMFHINNESITFKAGRSHLFPIRVGDIYVVKVEHEVERVAEHTMVESSKRKKAKSCWVKKCFGGTKGRTWMRKCIPRTAHQNHDQ